MASNEEKDQTIVNENSNIENNLDENENETIKEDDKNMNKTEEIENEEEKEENKSGNESESENEEEGEESEEELEEPKFKYLRLTAGTFDEYLKGDAASAVICGERILGVGTHSGKVYILDLMGNPIKVFNCHSTTVNCLSLDKTEQYIASASDDGLIIVNGIYTDFGQIKNYMRPMKAVALSPDFATNSNQRIVSGGMAGHLTMNTKGWIGYKDIILQEGDGPILSIKWKGKYLAWASDSGVKIYDTETSQRISFISRPENSPRPDLYPAHLYWRDEKELYIGWADTVKVARVMQHDPSLHPSILLSLPKVEILHIFRTGFIISGIAALKDQLVLLGYNGEMIYEDTDVNTLKPPNPPELRIVDIQNNQNVADVLTVQGYERFKATDYKLACTPTEDLFFVVSPKDLISCKEREFDDRIQWHLEHELYAPALELLQHNEQLRCVNDPDYVPTAYTISKVGKKYMRHLLSIQDYEAAGALCPSILGNDKTQWERWIFAFSEVGQLAAILRNVPTRELKLSSTIYEMILGYFLKADLQTFVRLIREWPKNIFNVKSIIHAAEGRNETEDGENPLLLEALGELHQLDNHPELALDYYLKLKSPVVFRLIPEFNLYGAISHRVRSLMEYDLAQYPTPQDYQMAGVKTTSELRAVSMLLRHVEVIPIKLVVEQLYETPLLLNAYLHGLFIKDPSLGAKWHDIQVELYAEFDYPLLLPFLKGSNDYSLEKAYRTCDVRDLVPEMIFILGRMGDHHKALFLIIERLNDVELAIDYAKDHDDPELWEALLKFSEDKPAFLKGLLESSGTHLPPSKVIKSIPNGLEIPGLKGSIIKILMDYHLQMSLRRGCEKVLTRDCITLSHHYKKVQRRGLRFGSAICDDHSLDEDLATLPSLKCQACHISMTMETSPMESTKDAILIFFCRHAYHAHCIAPKFNWESKLTMENENKDSTLYTYGKTSESKFLLQKGLQQYLEQIKLKGSKELCPRCLELEGTEGYSSTQGSSNSVSTSSRSPNQSIRLRWQYKKQVDLNLNDSALEVNQNSLLNQTNEDDGLPPMVKL